MTAAAMSERELQDAVVELARLLGYLVYHTHDSRRSAAGFPDLVLAGNGRVLFIELKSERGIESAAQLEWAYTLARAGAETYLFRPEHWTGGFVEQVLRWPARAP